MSIKTPQASESAVRSWRASQRVTSALLSQYNVRLAINPLGWTNDVIMEFGNETPVERFLAEAADCGYEGVEMGRKFPSDPHVVAQLLASANIDLASGWYSGQLATIGVTEELDNVAAHAALLAHNGAQVMVYGETALMPGGRPLDEPLSASPHLPTDEWKAYGQRLTEFGESLRSEYGLGLAYHAHLMTVTETESEIDHLMAVTGESVGLLLDTGHVTAGGGDISRVLEKYGHRVNHIHLKDIRREVYADARARDASFNDGVRAGMFTVPGDGFIDYSSVVCFVKGGHYTGWMVVEAEQDPEHAPPLAYARTAMRHVRSMFGRGSAQSAATAIPRHP